ncbi:hypothetical protein HMPREF9382_0030 [Streptococcus sanguinis SK115]|uniref:Uncharacterized protein n=1 Tax=Streptococcus sanguinis SK115 TaxID=888810 RepID=F0I5E7_STRSA|nr:hypothetical protein HMPREF9382_0030 [Streptococcus sanguinis SK115]
MIGFRHDYSLRYKAIKASPKRKISADPHQPAGIFFLHKLLGTTKTPKKPDQSISPSFWHRSSSTDDGCYMQIDFTFTYANNNFLFTSENCRQKRLEQASFIRCPSLSNSALEPWNASTAPP